MKPKAQYEFTLILIECVQIQTENQKIPNRLILYVKRAGIQAVWLAGPIPTTR